MASQNDLNEIKTCNVWFKNNWWQFEHQECKVAHCRTRGDSGPRELKLIKTKHKIFCYYIWMVMWYQGWRIHISATKSQPLSILSPRWLLREPALKKLFLTLSPVNAHTSLSTKMLKFWKIIQCAICVGYFLIVY